MAKHYKVWLEIEECDEETDTFETLKEIRTSALGNFDSLEKARNLIKLIQHYVDHERQIANGF